MIALFVDTGFVGLVNFIANEQSRENEEGTQQKCGKTLSVASFFIDFAGVFARARARNHSANISLVSVYERGKEKNTEKDTNRI